MSIAALVKTLMDAGVDLATVAAAVEAAACDDQAERRRAKDRERKRLKASAKSGIPRKSAESAEVGGIPRNSSNAPSLSKNPTPIDSEYREGRKEERETPVSKPAKPKAHDLPADWSPSEADREKAAKIGLTSREIDREAEKFRNHFANRAGTKGGRMLNWSLAWQNWCHRAVEWRAARAPQAAATKTWKSSEELKHDRAKQWNDLLHGVSADSEPAADGTGTVVQLRIAGSGY